MARVSLPIFILLVSFSKALSESPAECREWGFSDPACSDCESLSTFVSDEELADQCRQCCVRDESVTYTAATLQVCPERIG